MAGDLIVGHSMKMEFAIARVVKWIGFNLATKIIVPDQPIAKERG